MSRVYALVLTVAIAVLYGSTYQSFRVFSLANPGGATDAIHYVKMAEGDLPAEPEIQHHRWLTPAAAALVRPVASVVVQDPELATRLAFYLVNFSFSLVACVTLFALLQVMGYSALLSLLGVCVFASGRVISLVTATPLVDAAYFCAIAVVSYLTVARKTLLLALVLPLLVLTKETIIPFLLVPLLTEMRRVPVLWAGMAAAAMTFVISWQGVAGHESVVVDTMRGHVGTLGQTVRHLFTPSGVHDVLSGFSLLLPLSGIGAWLNARHRYHDVPAAVVATVPIAIGLALLSGNTGRMLFAAFPAVIAYALIAVEHVTRGNGLAGSSR